MLIFAFLLLILLAFGGSMMKEAWNNIPAEALTGTFFCQDVLHPAQFYWRGMFVYEPFFLWKAQFNIVFPLKKGWQEGKN